MERFTQIVRLVVLWFALARFSADLAFDVGGSALRFSVGGGLATQVTGAVVLVAVTAAWAWIQETA